MELNVRNKRKGKERRGIHAMLILVLFGMMVRWYGTIWYEEETEGGMGVSDILEADGRVTTARW